jgi:alanine dehydrogenase
MRRELDDTPFDRADLVAVLSREQVHHDNQINILGSVERGRSHGRTPDTEAAGRR